MAEMDQYLDFWNLMAYDYSGSWGDIAGHDANVYASDAKPAATPFNTDQAITYYTSHGVSPSKIVMGMPLYGRSFEDTDGPGTSYNGIGSGSWENGVWDYKDLPKAGAQVTELDQPVAAYSYDSSSREMISFDTPRITQMKADYIQGKGLGGGMWWECSSDKSGSESLISTVCLRPFFSLVHDSLTWDSSLALSAARGRWRRVRMNSVIQLPSTITCGLDSQGLSLVHSFGAFCFASLR